MRHLILTALVAALATGCVSVKKRIDGGYIDGSVPYWAAGELEKDDAEAEATRANAITANDCVHIPGCNARVAQDQNGTRATVGDAAVVEASPFGVLPGYGFAPGMMGNPLAQSAYLTNMQGATQPRLDSATADRMQTNDLQRRVGEVEGDRDVLLDRIAELEKQIEEEGGE